jgi:hypothetical protein
MSVAAYDAVAAAAAAVQQIFLQKVFLDKVRKSQEILYKNFESSMR